MPTPSRLQHIPQQIPQQGPQQVPQPGPLFDPPPRPLECDSRRKSEMILRAVMMKDPEQAIELTPEQCRQPVLHPADGPMEHLFNPTAH